MFRRDLDKAGDNSAEADKTYVAWYNALNDAVCEIPNVGFAVEFYEAATEGEMFTSELFDLLEMRSDALAAKAKLKKSTTVWDRLIQEEA